MLGVVQLHDLLGDAGLERLGTRLLVGDHDEGLPESIILDSHRRHKAAPGGSMLRPSWCLIRSLDVTNNDCARIEARETSGCEAGRRAGSKACLGA